MSFHDSYVRTTPFELAFPDPQMAHELWAAIEDESEAHGADLRDRQAFVMLGSVGAFLRRLQGPDAPPESIHQYGALVYHSYHFARSGHRPHLLSTAVSRVLALPGGPFSVPESPEGVGYAQFPRHLFWVRPAPDAPAEPVDGFFWTLSGSGVLQVLLAVGMRDDRPGLAVVPVPEAPWADAPKWVEGQVRESGPDFESTLPGGELDELYSFEIAGEALKFVARFLSYLASSPQAVVDQEPGSAGPDGPRPSIHPFARVDLHA